ncbi:V-type ATP synthase subunit E [Thermococcus waiotapuensis]|uniref:A-type ATP synthase subunit E n=1 Tax=Thermococcus waiotapuensis TaxID=90909 RepID=A0AAE4NVH5_9EURY|nr:V-type ATP synthase subunit E [Thermococcus waiotapuensis]MDV3104654.1 V-type ATP synthase subunit E [Thermococcus waiotapuensis]
MEGAELIIQEIQRAAEQKVQYILNEARGEAEKIKEEARKRAEVQAEWILRKARTQAEIEKQRIIANAKLEVRKKKLAVQEELIREVLSALRERLSSLPDEEYFETLVKLAREGVEELGLQEVMVSSNGRTLELISGRLNEFSSKIGARVILGEPLNTIGGIVVSDPVGKIRVDNTFESRIERMESELRAEIAKALFG